MSTEAIQSGAFQLEQRSGCSPFQPISPGKVFDGILQKVTHLHPINSSPATDTRVTLNITNGQKRSSLEADLSNTVDQIKKRIIQERKFGDSGSIGLLNGNRELQGPKTLRQENVKNMAMLLIFHKCPGG